MDRPTVEVYEREGANYAVRRGLRRPERAEAFAAAVDGPRLDLGCGPGLHLPLLGQPVFGADAAAAMVQAASAHAPVVQADLVDLPFGRRTLAGIWASKAHQHVPAAWLPLALADAHRSLRTGGRLHLTVFAADDPTRPTTEQVSDQADDLPGRWFTWWNVEHLATVVEAAGFQIESFQADEPAGPAHLHVEVVATARLALPDHVGPDMRLLCCGLNPSVHAAEAGMGFVTGSNRFWRAMTAAGLATRTHDPRHLLRVDRIGMTDLVKRPTPRADELTTAEYREGVERLAALCRWLRPAAVAMVGLAGWRAAVDRRATPGWQPERLGDTPVYVLPSTSGLNATTSLDDLVAHLRAAADGPDPTTCSTGDT